MSVYNGRQSLAYFVEGERVHLVNTYNTCWPRITPIAISAPPILSLKALAFFAVESAHCILRPVVKNLSLVLSVPKSFSKLPRIYSQNVDIDSEFVRRVVRGSWRVRDREVRFEAFVDVVGC